MMTTCSLTRTMTVYLPSLVPFLSFFLVFIVSPFLPTLCIPWVLPSRHLHYPPLTFHIGSPSLQHFSHRDCIKCAAVINVQLASPVICIAITSVLQMFTSPLLPCDSFLPHPSFLPCAFLRSSFALLNIIDLDHFQYRNPLTDMP